MARVRPVRYRLTDVAGNHHAPTQVVFECEESERSFGRSLATHMIVGGSASLPDTYGMRASKLADLLNRYRAAALGTSTTPDPGDA